jgi:hypothetical protein
MFAGSKLGLHPLGSLASTFILFFNIPFGKKSSGVP